MYGVTTLTLAIFALIINILLVNNQDVKFSAENPMFFKLFVPELLNLVAGGLATPLLTCLVAYHTHLILRNKTTQEEVRNKYSKWGGNPYDRGNANCYYFLNKQQSLVFIQN